MTFHNGQTYGRTNIHKKIRSQCINVRHRSTPLKQCKQTNIELTTPGPNPASRNNQTKEAPQDRFSDG